MSIFEKFFYHIQRHNNNRERQSKQSNVITKSNFGNFYSCDDDFSIFNKDPFDNYLCNAWINIAVNILIRNLARADFVLERDGEELKNGPLFNLFHRPNKNLSRYDLWKETAAWWLLEGEAVWWFGPDYAGGLPQEIYILNPRQLQLEAEGLSFLSGFKNKNRRW